VDYSMLNKETILEVSPNELPIWVVAEDGLARAGLAALISALPGCRVAGQMAGGEKIYDELEIYQPDIVVWDLGIDPVRSLERLEDLRSYDIRIIVLVPGEDIAGAASLYKVRGILPRDVKGHTLLAAIRSVAEGLIIFDSHFAEELLSAKKVIPEQLAEPLTPRESQVLQLLGSGLPNKAIASRLAISEQTVKFHVNSILSKLGAQSRTEAVSRGTRLGLIKL
jgi:DNA-binding NarL/FixJ family response regulator